MTKILIFILVLSILILSFQVLFGSFPKSSPPLPDLLNELTSTPLPTPYLPSLTLDSTFSPDHDWTKDLDPEKTVTLIATGDIMPARITNIKATQKNDLPGPLQILPVP